MNWKGLLNMKKLIATCFAFMFLLAVVAGCPGTSSKENSKGGAASGAVDFSEGDEGSSALSSDEAVEDVEISLDE